ncbi:MAG TPA: TIGR03032 family protein [Candidatus Cybelea sp.]|nr:TIGR03032 family protein [Candidatus Cybelea sp.]
MQEQIHRVQTEWQGVTLESPASPTPIRAPKARDLATYRPKPGGAVAETGKPISSYQLTLSPGLRLWMEQHRVALALSTYELGRVITLGAGSSTLNNVDESFDSAMALLHTTRGFYLGTYDRIWRFENDLQEGEIRQGSDRLYVPRQQIYTGAVDIHDLDIDASGRLLAVVTRSNCIAVIGADGAATPLWRPHFIDRVVPEDRCHLNGFCLEDGRPAYATLIGPSNQRDGWREYRRDGGRVIDVRTQKVVARHLAMPHSPRLHRNRLWVLESGSGWFGWVDRDRRRFERLIWLPGFLRGLRFVGHYAVITSSSPRDALFTGLPLQEELAWRGAWPVTGAHVVNLETGEVEHRLTITGSVREVYDVAIIPGATAPRLSRLGTRP